MAYTGILGGLYAANLDVPQSSYVSSEVHRQLKSSLFDYREGNRAVIGAWENTMKEDCCCGVDGFGDFLEIGVQFQNAAHARDIAKKIRSTVQTAPPIEHVYVIWTPHITLQQEDA